MAQEIKRNEDGTPIEAVGPLGIGHVRDNRYGFTAYTSIQPDGPGTPRVDTTIPRCQGAGTYGIGQCDYVGKFLEPDRPVNYDRETNAYTTGGQLTDGESPFYWCGTHAPSQDAARKTAKRHKQQAADREREEARASAARERKALDLYLQGVVDRTDVLEATKDAIIAAFKAMHPDHELVRALVDATTAREEYRANREVHEAAFLAELEAQAEAAKEVTA